MRKDTPSQETAEKHLQAAFGDIQGMPSSPGQVPMPLAPLSLCGGQSRSWAPTVFQVVHVPTHRRVAAATWAPKAQKQVDNDSDSKQTHLLPRTTEGCGLGRAGGAALGERAGD